MDLRRALFIAALAACLLPAVPAAAQAPWPEQPAAQRTAQGTAQATAPWPGQPQQPAAPSPWLQPAQPLQQAPPASAPFSQPQAQQSEPPCIKDFLKLREDAQKKAGALQAAGKRKASPKEACGLFNAFYAAEAKLIKFSTANQASCGIPPQAIEGMKAQHTQTASVRANVCRIAAAPPRPAGPNLSDALSAPIPNENNIKTGRGTFDTLTGSPIGK